MLIARLKTDHKKFIVSREYGDDYFTTSPCMADVFNTHQEFNEWNNRHGLTWEAVPYD